MAKVRVSRSVNIPDPLRVSRYQKMPELGPRILFFSGGTALSGLSQTLKNYTHNSIHLVTPFDSGGSSAELRQAFDMPAIGDMRSRLMALADDTVLGHPEVYRLFTYRFPTDGQGEQLRTRLADMAAGKDPLVHDISKPMRGLICHQLGYFVEAMPTGFDLRGASIGNLILAGGYLNNHRELDSILFLFEKLVSVKGTVRAIVEDNLHLCAELEDGRQVLGQHRLTGKEVDPLASPIGRLGLSESVDQCVAASATLSNKNRKLIENAELICYPPGSFYSSVMANLLPAGVGRAIAANDNPKVYVPNLGTDPEQLGMSVMDSVAVLLAKLRIDRPDALNHQLLNYVLVDSKRGNYDADFSSDFLRRHGIALLDVELVSEQSAPYYDNDLLVAALLSLT